MRCFPNLSRIWRLSQRGRVDDAYGNFTIQSITAIGAMTSISIGVSRTLTQASTVARTYSIMTNGGDYHQGLLS